MKQLMTHDANCPRCTIVNDTTFRGAKAWYCVGCRCALQFLNRHKIDGSSYCDRCAAGIDLQRLNEIA